MEARVQGSLTTRASRDRCVNHDLSRCETCLFVCLSVCLSVCRTFSDNCNQWRDRDRDERKKKKKRKHQRYEKQSKPDPF